MKIILSMIIAVAMLATAFLLGLYWDELSFDNSPPPPVIKQKITYYQWNDEKGRVMISKTKPKGVPDVISFQATEELENYSYNLDPELAKKAAEYHAKFDEKENNNDSSLDSSPLGYNPVEKSRDCINAVNEIQTLKHQQLEGSDSKSQKRLQQLQKDIQSICG